MSQILLGADYKTDYHSFYIPYSQMTNSQSLGLFHQSLNKQMHIIKDKQTDTRRDGLLFLKPL